MTFRYCGAGKPECHPPVTLPKHPVNRQPDQSVGETELRRHFIMDIFVVFCFSLPGSSGFERVAFDGSAVQPRSTRPRTR
jgi:hypothetical protein